MEENVVFNSEDVKENKVFGVLSYFYLLFLIPLFAAKDSQYAKFHTNQGLVFTITSTILLVATAIVNFILALVFVFIPIIGWILSGLIWFAVCAANIALLVIGIMNACSGEPKKLPIIGDFTLIK